LEENYFSKEGREGVGKKYGTRFVVWFKCVQKNEKKKIENLGLIIERLTVGIA